MTRMTAALAAPLVMALPLLSQETLSWQARVIPAGAECAMPVSGPDLTVKLAQEEGDELWLGNAGTAPQAVRVAVAVTAEDAPLGLYIDADGDGDVDDEQPMWADATTNKVRSNTGFITLRTWSFESAIAIGASSYEARVDMVTGKTYPNLKFRCTGTACLYAQGELEGETHHAVILDEDGDGTYGSRGDYWRIIRDDLLGQRSADRPLNKDSMVEAFEPIFVGGSPLTLHQVTDEEIALQRSEQDDTLEAYLARRAVRVAAGWTDTFDEGFRSQYAEGDRPRAIDPIPWIRDLDLKRALARAQDEGKPILAEFDADWCIWCRALDEITFSDAEVAAYVREHFIPLKLNAELVTSDLASRYEVEGFPNMPVLAADGTKVEHIKGFHKPSGFLERLRAAVQAHGDSSAATKPADNPKKD